VIENNKSTAPKPFVFVLMPFESKFHDIYKFGIKGAADDVGAYAERVDEQIFSEGILDRIFNQISKADVVVADMTGRNPNVFYEVGYAHALGKRVILLTQNVDDIPFDLKHRQHTVYGGKIELLRNELAAKLQWAIAEVRRLGKSSSAERYSLQVNGVDIPEIGSSDEVGVIEGSVTGYPFLVPIHLRNDSFETTLGITHVYLFSSKDSLLVPAKNPFDSSFLFSTSNLSSPTLAGATGESEPLDSFTANPVDAPDGLTKQFRLPVTFAALPPGAVEESKVYFMFQENATKAESEFRLRLHSAAQYHEYRFRFKINLKPEQTKEGESVKARGRKSVKKQPLKSSTRKSK
jgi:hypothetical protein